jgi:hypothetical protein
VKIDLDAEFHSDWLAVFFSGTEPPLRYRFHRLVFKA